MIVSALAAPPARLILYRGANRAVRVQVQITRKYTLKKRKAPARPFPFVSAPAGATLRKGVWERVCPVPVKAFGLKQTDDRQAYAVYNRRGSVDLQFQLPHRKTVFVCDGADGQPEAAAEECVRVVDAAE